MKIRRLLFIISLTFSGFVFSQTKQDTEKIIRSYDLKKIKELEVSLRKKEAIEKKAAYEAAAINGWPIIIKGDNGSLQELMKLTPDGFPVYYSTENVAAARSTRTDFLNSGGGLGLSLDGQGMVARVWDGGTVRRSHSGFGGRVETVDNAGSTFSSHPTHVTGTIIALPWNSSFSTIKGMASQATARTFDWTDDESEALSEVTLGMLVSNHSYGVPITGSNGPLPSWYIGSYVEDSRVWDEIAYLSPY
ncbi:MAG: peptidase S8, partial [Flavobacterium sp.]|nr:peptidase S8 [Flavobacterium sp.]